MLAVDFQDIFDTIEAYEKKFKDKWEEFLKDKSVPLEDRWNTFLKAPISWKHEAYWIQRPMGLEYNWWDSGFDKGNVVTATHFIELYDSEEYVSTEDEDEDEDNEPVDLNELKEWFLERNMHSFRLDW